MKSDLQELEIEIRGVSHSLTVLSSAFEGDEVTHGNDTIHFMLYALQRQLDRIADDIDNITIELIKKMNKERLSS